jgi:hypothetical protein
MRKMESVSHLLDIEVRRGAVHDSGLEAALSAPDTFCLNSLSRSPTFIVQSNPQQPPLYTDPTSCHDTLPLDRTLLFMVPTIVPESQSHL